MRRHSDLIAAILIGLAPFVYFLPATLGRIVLAEADAVVFGMPLRIATAEMLREGHLPLWNPYIFCGMPLFASAQAGTLFPLNWGFLVLPPGLAMNLAVLLSFAAAGVGAFLCARRSGTNLLGASITALVWQFSGFAIGHIAHTNMLHMYAVLPWIFWSIDGYLIRPGRRRGALVSLIVALGAFTGHPQTLAYGLILACAYLCVHGMAEKETRWQTSLAAIGFLLVGLFLGGIQILPTLELLQNSMREKVTYEYVTSYSLPPVFLLSWFAPYIVGGGDGTLFRAPYTGEPLYPEYCGYVALAPLMLAGVAASLGRDWRTRFWTGTALVCLLLALGRFLPFELYRVVYHVPILNLFRVPARHLMEVDLAVAILAGRAVTMLPAVRPSRRLVVSAAAVLVVVFSAWSAVTWLRPAIFTLGRPGPVTVLRAPELFLPVVLAILSGWAVFRFARARRVSGAILLAVIAADLALWGQFAGWRVNSVPPAYDRFETPQFVKEMREEIARNGPFRIVTLDRPLGDAVAQAPATPGIDINLQPDVYMVHRIENAAGYDGFGFKRYSRLAGDMDVAGEFPDANRSLLVSRELDLLNVRYLLAAPGHPPAPLPPLPADTKLGDFLFAQGDLGIPFLEGGTRGNFATPPLATTRLAVVTSLAWAADLVDDTVAGRITLRGDDGRTFSFDLRVGRDTAEWAYDRPDLVMRHSRAPIAFSGKAERASGGGFASHTYVSSFALPERSTIVGGSFEAARNEGAPKLVLGVQRVSFIDEADNRTVPMRPEWITERTTEALAARWLERKRGENVVIYENQRALPRAWLATEARAVQGENALEVIRTGKFPDGAEWDPLRTVLLEESIEPGLISNPTTPGSIKFIRSEPNKVEIAAKTVSPAILVLADNYYPGWRVSINGNDAALLRANYNLRGVRLGPGEHTVRFSYRPGSVLAGLALSLLTATALLFWPGRRPA